MAHDALSRAVDNAGGQAALARAVGVTQPSVWHWVHKSRRVPAEYVIPVEGATGVSRHDLRPDLYPVEGSVALCGMCDVRAEDPHVATCTAANCPMRERSAA